MKNTLISAGVGIVVGTIVGYTTFCLWNGSSDSPVPQAVEQGDSMELQVLGWIDAKEQFNEFDSGKLAQEFEDIYTDNKTGKMARCQLCLEAWLKLDPTSALEVALAKHEQGAQPDSLVALRAIGGPFWKEILAFWDAGGSRYGSVFAEAIRVICKDESPSASARMALIGALGIEAGESVSQSLEASKSFSGALEKLQSEGVEVTEEIMNILGSVYAKEILESGLKLGFLSEEGKAALVKAVIETAGKDDPIAAMRFGSLHDWDYRQGNYALAVETALAADPKAAEDWIFSQREDRLLSFHGVSAILSYYASVGDAEASQRVYERYQVDFPGKRLSEEVLEDAARLDPGVFVPILQSLSPGEVPRDLILEYAQLDPKAAAAMIDTLDDRHRLPWEVALAQAEFGDDYEGLISHLEEHESEWAIPTAVSALKTEDPERLWASLTEISDPEIRGSAINGMIDEMLPLSADLVIAEVERIPEGSAKTGAMISLGASLGIQDPRSGSELLQEWKESGTMNDIFTNAYINSATRVDWRGAAAWVSEIQDPELRQNAARDVRRSAEFQGIPKEEIDSYFPDSIELMER